MRSRFPCPHCHKLVTSTGHLPKRGVYQCPCGKFFAIDKVDPETQMMEIMKVDSKSMIEDMKKDGLLPRY